MIPRWQLLVVPVAVDTSAKALQQEGDQKPHAPEKDPCKNQWSHHTDDARVPLMLPLDHHSED